MRTDQVKFYFEKKYEKFIKNSCRDKASNCRRDQRYCSDENTVFTYTYCPLTCGTCGKRPPTQNAPVQNQVPRAPLTNVGQIFVHL